MIAYFKLFEICQESPHWMGNITRKDWERCTGPHSHNYTHIHTHTFALMYSYISSCFYLSSDRSIFFPFFSQSQRNSIWSCLKILTFSSLFNRPKLTPNINLSLIPSWKRITLLRAKKVWHDKFYPNTLHIYFAPYTIPFSSMYPSLYVFIFFLRIHVWFLTVRTFKSLSLPFTRFTRYSGRLPEESTRFD